MRLCAIDEPTVKVLQLKAVYRIIALGNGAGVSVVSGEQSRPTVPR